MNGVRRMIQSPLTHRLLTTRKAYAPASLAGNPRFVTTTMPSSTHAGVLTAKATKNTRSMVDIKALVDGFHLKLAVGASKRESARFDTHGVASEPSNDIRVGSSLKMPPSVLLERAVNSD